MGKKSVRIAKLLVLAVFLLVGGKTASGADAVRLAFSSFSATMRAFSRPSKKNCSSGAVST